MNLLIPFARSWRELILRLDLTPDVILEETIDRPGSSSIEDLAAFLDEWRFPGMLAQFAARIITEIRPLLEESLPWTPEVEIALSDPSAYFEEQDAEIILALAVHKFFGLANGIPPGYVLRALFANILLGMKDYSGAIDAGSCAPCEKEVDDFERKLDADDPEAEAAMFKFERRKAEILVDLIQDFRRRA